MERQQGVCFSTGVHEASSSKAHYAEASNTQPDQLSVPVQIGSFGSAPESTERTERAPWQSPFLSPRLSSTLLLISLMAFGTEKSISYIDEDG